MSTKELLQIGNPTLRSKSEAVDLSDLEKPEIVGVIADLKDSLTKEVAALSAVQIGCLLQIFVTNVRVGETKELIVFINPEIISKSESETVRYEGCGSVLNTELFGPVKRADSVVVEAYDEKGERFHKKVSGFFARVIQHEYDHLHGVLFTDLVEDNSQLISKEEYIKQKVG